MVDIETSALSQRLGVGAGLRESVITDRTAASCMPGIPAAHPAHAGENGRGSVAAWRLVAVTSN